MPQKPETNALVPVAADATMDLFPVLGPVGKQQMDVVRENLAGDIITPSMLDRIAIPTGGGTRWLVKTVFGEETPLSITGIVIHFSTPRVFWQTPFGEGEPGPPDCSSPDGRCGDGTPGGMCATCLLNEWKSDLRGGNRKACRELRRLFVLLPGTAMPTIITVPPTSLNAMRTFNFGLAQRSLSYYAVQTTLALEKMQTKAGLTYSVIAPTVAGVLSDEAQSAVAAYRKMMLPLLATVAMTAAEVQENEADEGSGNTDTK